MKEKKISDFELVETDPTIIAIHESINEAIRARIEQEEAMIEIACEQAIQGGKHGVLVLSDSAGVSPIVPYGHVWYLNEPLRVDYFDKKE